MPVVSLKHYNAILTIELSEGKLKHYSNLMEHGSEQLPLDVKIRTGLSNNTGKKLQKWLVALLQTLNSQNVFGFGLFVKLIRE